MLDPVFKKEFDKEYQKFLTEELEREEILNELTRLGQEMENSQNNTKKESDTDSNT